MNGYDYFIVLSTIGIVCSSSLAGVWLLYNQYGQTTKIVVGTVLLSLPSYPFLGNYMTYYEIALAVSGFYYYSVYCIWLFIPLVHWIGLLFYGIGAYIFENYHDEFYRIIPDYIENHELFHLFTVLSTCCLFLLVDSLYQHEHYTKFWIISLIVNKKEF